MKKIVLVGLTATVLLASCAKEQKKTENARYFDVNVNMENDFINIESTKRQYNAHSGDYYSGVDSIAQYGAGYVKKIDDTLKGYNLDVYVSVWMREMKAPNEGSIAFSLNNAGGTKDWKALQCKSNNFKPGEWIQVIDTIRYTSDQLKDATELKIFSMKSTGSDFLDVDDLRIKYKFHK